MRYFIVEDDRNIVKILSQIISDQKLGNVMGYALDGTSAVDKIRAIEPDIVLVDVFIPGINGIQLVSKMKQENPETLYVMISSVSNKDMIAKAYESGIEAYIQKPINAVEVQSVLSRVNDYYMKHKKFEQIKEMFDLNEINVQTESADYDKVIKQILKRIGILGEIGTQDIIDVVSYLMNANLDLSQCTIKEICEKFDANPKSVEQRIRRTAMIGLTNLAHLGIEDYLNDVYAEYACSLYNLVAIKTEMDYIRKKSDIHGKVSIRKFIEGMIFYCEKDKYQKNSEKFKVF